MQIKDMKISRQLKYGLSIMVFLVILLGAVSLYQASLLWKETKGLYEHPLQVRLAIGDVSTDILNIALQMKELFLADSYQEKEQIMIAIDAFDLEAVKHFDLLRTTYLGPKQDIDSAYALFVRWRSIRSETYRLFREGNIEQAKARTKVSGVHGSFILKMMAAIEKVSDFQIARGDKFYQDVLAHKNDLAIQSVILLAVVFFMALVIGYFLMKHIREPLHDILLAATAIRDGNFTSRSRYKSGNEFGILSAAFNDLAETLEKENKRKENFIAIADVMLKEHEIQRFCDELLKVLLEQTNSQLAAIYILNEEKTDFHHFASIGLSAQAWASFSASGNEGEFGKALATKKISHIRKIPLDAHMTFSTVSGDFVPREIVTIPILSGDQVVAVISLASIRTYPQETTNLLNDIYLTMTARITGVLAFDRLDELLSKLQIQNMELENQRTELSQQRDELNEQNLELEMQKRQLDETALIKNNFIARMSHELRTPLNSILALSGVLKRRLQETIPAEELSYLDIVTRNGRQLLDLINDILDLSRITAGYEVARPSKFNLADLIHDLLSGIRIQAEEKEIELFCYIGETLPEITTDYSKCMHILQNVIANAVKFTDKGSVTISAKSDGKFIRISIADTGVGIDKTLLPFIFDEFRQADETTTRNFGGTGLGLAIAKKYADLLDGEILVQSESGVGSTFTIILPVNMEGETLQPGSDREQKRPVDSKTRAKGKRKASGLGMTILLVEDSEPSIIQIRDILTQDDYQVEVARNGREALLYVSTSVPDAMILDLMMPEIDGFEVLKSIRANKNFFHLPVLILTAKHLTQEELSFLEGNNIHQLVQKGDISRDELIQAVSNMVHGKK